MNQKDYKAIAKIIEDVVLDLGNSLGQELHKNIIIRLADYFEKDSNEMMKLHKGDNPLSKRLRNNHYFDKKQFLKDCGVGEK